MAVLVEESQDGAVIEVTASGKLSREDYGTFVPLLEDRMRQGKVKILFSMQDFHGWDAGALWEDIKFDLRHFGDIERLAMVGDKKWEEGMAWFCKPFTSAKVAYFDQGQIDTARSWLRGE